MPNIAQNIGATCVTLTLKVACIKYDNMLNPIANIIILFLSFLYLSSIFLAIIIKNTMYATNDGIPVVTAICKYSQCTLSIMESVFPVNIKYTAKQSGPTPSTGFSNKESKDIK